ncbi:TcpQ domain-containing protein [Pectobacterium parvum]|uniref:TcpQ domain-containing protein n=1 Tax=Pectobacterium parvum TaxID=2778550 RepID=UPI000DC6465F|nr:TcpQ domain-containing protein [Pectobacterium parvum]
MSFTERAGLFPVLLLTGCAQPVIVTGPPSGSVVDSMLARSAADISAMQYRIHQTGPSAKRPVSSSAAKPVASMLLTPASSALTGKAVTQLPVSEPGAGPKDGFVQQGGTAPTLRAALRKIVPYGQTVVFDKAVAADAPELWRWTGNDRWQYVAGKMLVSRNLKATVNAKTNTVTIEPTQRMQTASVIGQPVPRLVPPANFAEAAPQGAAKPVPNSSAKSNPFRGEKPALNISGTVSTSVKAAPIVSPALRIWKIEKGTTLRQGYEQWASQEVCRSGNTKWTVRWDTGTNYPIDYTLTFHAASFEVATTQLFDLWKSAKIPLFASGYRQQCLVIVSDVPLKGSESHEAK